MIIGNGTEVLSLGGLILRVMMLREWIHRLYVSMLAVCFNLYA